MGRRVSDCCPRCERPLTEDRHLRYCDRCGYEPPESAALPVVPPHFEDGGEAEVLATRKREGQSTAKGGQ